MNTVTVILITLAVIACAALLTVIAAFICSRTACRVPRYGEKDLLYILPREQYDVCRGELTELTRQMLALPCEDVYITSFDGKRLHGRYYHTADGAPVQLMMHGYHGLGPRDFCGGLKEALAAGYNALVPDERAHWGSEGRWLSFGINERIDCRDWVKYISDRFGAEQKIILFGISMGAATVLMASELDLPGNVLGVVADCGYNTPEAIIKNTVRGMKLPVWPVWPLIRLGGRLFGGFDLRSASPRAAMEHCRYPVLFIHGDDDRFVPFYMSRENYEHCVSPLKRCLWVPGAGHGLAYMVDKEGYVAAVGAFLEEIGAA